MNIQELEAKADKALNYLAETDELHAQLKAKQGLLHEHKKTVIAAGYFSSSETSATARNQDAHRMTEYTEHLKLMEGNDVEFITIDNKRKRAIATIDLFRTMSANQRRG